MCCAKFIAKSVLFIANLLFSLLGLAIVGVGIAAIYMVKDLNDILPINAVSTAIIALGAIVFVIGFLGCCGAIGEYRWMLICYSILVGLILAASIYLAVMVMGSQDKLIEIIDGWIVTAFNNEDLRSVFNIMEALFQCCGTDGSSSYTLIGEVIPPSCCNIPGELTTPPVCEASEAFDGCSVMVAGWVETISSAVGYILLVLIVVEMIAVVLALFLTHSITMDMRETKAKQNARYARW